MRTFDEAIREEVNRELIRSRPAETTILLDSLELKGNREETFEREIFNFLLENRASLGLTEVQRFRNQKADGAVLTSNGQLIPIEIKYRLNIASGCTALWQLMHFSKIHGRITDAAIIFKEFSPDWDSISGGRDFEIGWARWYQEHHEFGGIRVHLLKYTEGSFLTFTDAVL